MWIFLIVLQLAIVLHGLREDKQRGVWSWRKSLFVLGFALLELGLTIVPATHIESTSRFFQPICVSCWALAAVNVVLLIVVARRWMQA